MHSHPLPRLHRRLQAVLVDAVGLGTPGVRVNENDAVVVHQVVDVALQEQVSAQCLRDLVGKAVPVGHSPLCRSLPFPRNRRPVPGIVRSPRVEGSEYRAQSFLQELATPFHQGDQLLARLNRVGQVLRQMLWFLFRQRPDLPPHSWFSGSMPLERRVIRIGQRKRSQQTQEFAGPDLRTIQASGEFMGPSTLQGDNFSHGVVRPNRPAAAPHRVARNNQRRERLVDQRVIGLVHQDRLERPLHSLGWRGLQVVPQVIKSQLPHGAVYDVAAIDVAAFARFRVRQDRAAAQPQGTVDRLQQRLVPFRQVVVGRGHVDASAQHGVQRGGEGYRHGFALTGIHLHHSAPEHVNARQHLLVCGPEPKSTICVPASRSVVELRWQQDVAGPPVTALFGHIGNGIGDGLRVLSQSGPGAIAV